MQSFEATRSRNSCGVTVAYKSTSMQGFHFCGFADQSLLFSIVDIQLKERSQLAMNENKEK